MSEISDLKYDVLIVGSGPAALGAAYELTEKSSLKIAIIEKEKYCSGGLANDCKLNLTPEIGMDLKHLGVEYSEVEQIIKWIDLKFLQHGADPTLHGTDNSKVKELKVRVEDSGAVLVPCMQRHVGTDRAITIIKGMRDELIERGVDFFLETVVDAIEKNEDIVCHTSKGQISSKYLLLAPGRGGSHWLRQQADSLGIEHNWGKIDIGVRLEMLNEAYPITSIIYDPKIRIPLENGDYAKTFCTNLGGKVRIESDADSMEFEGKRLKLINGDALHGKRFPNTNFAVMYKMELTEPIADTKAVGRDMIIHTYRLGNWKPLIQRMGDFMSKRRSKWETFFSAERRFNIVKPSLTIGTNKNGGVLVPGDIRLALPGRIIDGLQKAFETLDRIAGKHVANIEILNGKGEPTGNFRQEVVHILHPSTIIYAPEIKFGDSIYRNCGNLETNIPGIFVMGNSNNTSGIIAAWVSGIVSARGVMKREKEPRQLKLEITAV